MNLSNWFHGGYQDWRRSKLGEKSDCAPSLAPSDGERAGVRGGCARTSHALYKSRQAANAEPNRANPHQTEANRTY
jgi:hypothetical protein